MKTHFLHGRNKLLCIRYFNFILYQLKIMLRDDCLQGIFFHSIDTRVHTRGSIEMSVDKYPPLIFLNFEILTNKFAQIYKNAPPEVSYNNVVQEKLLLILVFFFERNLRILTTSKKGKKAKKIVTHFGQASFKWRLFNQL